MSLRKDSFERILAFSKLEEAMNMDMETTRWLSVLESMLYCQAFCSSGIWRKSWTMEKGMVFNSLEMS